MSEYDDALTSKIYMLEDRYQVPPSVEMYVMFSSVFVY
jgi:hypothetical protein